MLVLLCILLCEMKLNISSVLGLPENCVNVKGKTEEGLGFTGKGQGIAAQAVALLDSSPFRIENIIQQFRSKGSA